MRHGIASGVAIVNKFLAVDVHPLAKAEIEAVLKELRSIEGVRWSDPDSLHYTIHFFGEIPDEELDNICLLTSQAAAAVEPFPLGVTGFGRFGSTRSPSILWLGTDTGKEQLTLLAEACHLVLGQAGYKPDTRDFVPHLTLGRVVYWSPESEQAFQKISADAPSFGIFTVREVVLFETSAKDRGPRYLRKAAIQLGTGKVSD